MGIIKESKVEWGPEKVVITLKVDDVGVEHLFYAGQKIDFNTLIDRVGTFDAYNVMSELAK